MNHKWLKAIALVSIGIAVASLVVFGYLYAEQNYLKNSARAQTPEPSLSTVVYSQDVNFGGTFPNELHEALGDFEFTIHVDSINSQTGDVKLAYSMSQGGADRLGQLQALKENDVVVEDFRGYTFKILVKQIVPASCPCKIGTDDFAIINIQVLH
jgi:hypothetical protein